MGAAELANEEQVQHNEHKVTHGTTLDKSDKEAGAIMADDVAEKEVNEADKVRFEEKDPLNPLCWPTSRKWLIVILVALTLMIDTIGTTSIVPAAPQVLAEFGHTNNTIDLVFLVSIWELGGGIGPFCYAPLAEICGRLAVYHGGNVLFLLFLTASALSTNMSMLIGFRFLSGFACTALTLGPAIVGDLFDTKQRGLVMAVSTAVPAIGPVTAPIMGSYIAQAKGWRWTVWIVVIAQGALTTVSFILFRETYKVKILEKKARVMRETTGNPRLKSYLQSHVDKTIWVQRLMRPIMMLVFSPPVLIVSVYGAFIYGTNYLIFTTLAKVMEDNYGFGQGPVGVAFLANTIGNVLAMLIYGMFSDRYLKQRRLKGKSTKPEHRLIFMMAGAILLPIGLFLYGWTAQFKVQWMAPLIGTVLGFIAVALVPVVIIMLPYGETLRGMSRVSEHIDQV